MVDPITPCYAGFILFLLLFSRKSCPWVITAGHGQTISVKLHNLSPSASTVQNYCVEYGQVKHTDMPKNRRFNPCYAELFPLYFSSFEAGIADAISSFK